MQDDLSIEILVEMSSQILVQHVIIPTYRKRKAQLKCKYAITDELLTILVGNQHPYNTKYLHKKLIQRSRWNDLLGCQ